MKLAILPGSAKVRARIPVIGTWRKRFVKNNACVELDIYWMTRARWWRFGPDTGAIWATCDIGPFVLALRLVL